MGKAVVLGAAGETPRKEQTFLSSQPPNHVKKATPEREGNQPPISLSTPQRVDTAAKRAEHLELMRTKNDDAGPASSAPVVSEGGAASDAVDESSGDSDKWEKIEVPSKAYSTSNPFLGEPESETNKENGQSGAASPGQDLSASMEGAIAAGSELNEAGLSESVAAVIQANQFDENVSKWNTAVTKITEMGFDDITTIISLLEKHATPENFETKLQVIVGELLSGMPVLN